VLRSSVTLTVFSLVLAMITYFESLGTARRFSVVL
jgi:hypothetical protein